MANRKKARNAAKKRKEIPQASKSPSGWLTCTRAFHEAPWPFIEKGEGFIAVYPLNCSIFLAL